MDTVIFICSIFATGIALFILFYAPTIIGEPRKPYTASDYIFDLMSVIALLLLAGRGFGLW